MASRSPGSYLRAATMRSVPPRGSCCSIGWPHSRSRCLATAGVETTCTMSEASALVALDTNILIYAEGIAQHSRDTHKPAIARRLIAALPPPSVVIPAQVLGELYRVLVGKAGRTPTAARETLMMW